jgi:hypothetical protein
MRAGTADQVIVPPHDRFRLATPRLVQRQQDPARDPKQTLGENRRALARQHAAFAGKRA